MVFFGQSQMNGERSPVLDKPRRGRNGFDWKHPVACPEHGVLHPRGEMSDLRAAGGLRIDVACARGDGLAVRERGMADVDRVAGEITYPDEEIGFRAQCMGWCGGNEAADCQHQRHSVASDLCAGADRRCGIA